MGRGLAVRTFIVVGLVSAVGFTSAVAIGKSDKLKLVANLDGAQERPSAGDPDGTGTAKIVIEGNTACFKLKWDDIAIPLTGGHIHKAPAGTAGPIVVDLLNNADRIKDDKAMGCVSDVDAAQVAANPAGFYVNLHNSAFPAGAIRGQLEVK